MATFITSKSAGQDITINVNTSTGYWKYNHDGSNSSVFSDGSQTITVGNLLKIKAFTIIPCLSNGTVSGDITVLYLQDNQLTSFDGTDLSGLTHLYLYTNQLTSFDGTDLTSLTTLSLGGNQLTSFDGTGLTSLYQLDLGINQLTSFDGTGLTSLYQLGLDSNQLTSFDGTGLTSLYQLGLDSNQLTSFDGTGLTSLYQLGLGHNQITSLDGFIFPTSLTFLNLIGNNLTSLDVSPMVSLTNLYLANSYGIGGNPMTAVSNNSILDQLNANGVENGNFFTINGRTSAGTADYDSLVGKGWNLLGLDLIVSGNGKLRIKGVTTGVGSTISMLYNISIPNQFELAIPNYIRYNQNGPQILTDTLTFSLMGRGPKDQVNNSTLLNSITVNQLIKITQENNPEIYQQFRVMGLGSNWSESEITYTVAFDVFTISDFLNNTPVIVTVM